MIAKSPNISLRPAIRSDAGFILALEEAGMRAHAEAIWGCWRPSATPETIDLAGHEIILSEGVPVGCIACKSYRDHFALTKLYIAVEARRRGIGARALTLKTQSVGLTVRLRTLATNADAVRFYVREGFCVINSDAERTYLEREELIPQAQR